MLRSAGNVVILGEPGSGKSTLLRYLAANCAASDSDDASVPLLLPLREIAQKESLVAEHAAQFATDVLQLPMPEGFFQRLLQEGRCLVCLDALDEVPPSDRRRVAGRVEQMVRRYPKNLFVVTSRRAGYDAEPLDPRIFNSYAVRPMEGEDVTENARSDRHEGAVS
jgi:predicted NACHT family NTPase